jgi:uncharacterized YigZ family protein
MADNLNPYKTVLENSSIESKVRGSRFIGTILNVDSKIKANVELDLIRKKYWDSTHNCYAYRIAPYGLESKMSDDGEPSGSAGKPILFILQKAEIVNTLIVVTRYFGGLKLGVGGLVRAYSECAKLVIENSKITEVYPTEIYKIFVQYEDMKYIRPIIDNYAISFDEEFHDVINYTVKLKKIVGLEFTDKIIESSQGRAGWTKLEN